MPISAYYPDGSRIVVPPEAVDEWKSAYKSGLTTLGLAVWYAPLEPDTNDADRIATRDDADVPARA